MLRITVQTIQDTLTLRVEGKLVGPWVAELKAAWLEAGRSETPVRLDLGAITFVDAAGSGLLRDLVRDGCEVVACSNFVAELLSLEMNS